METCYKLFPSECLQKFTLREERFGFEPQITAKLARAEKGAIHEISIDYKPRTSAEGKKIGWKDGFRALYCIVRYAIRD